MSIFRAKGLKSLSSTQFPNYNTAYLQQLKYVSFQERRLNVLKCYNFDECKEDTTALQWRILQTALWHYTY